MSARRAVLLAVVASLVVLAAPSSVAQATSCVDTETLLVDAEHAFIGAVVSRDRDVLTFDVSEVVRGDLPDPFVVRDESESPGGASAFRVGAEVGLVA